MGRRAHSDRLKASRKALRWWVIIAAADLPPSERATVRITRAPRQEPTK